MGRRNTGERGSTDRARPAGRKRPGGAEGAAAGAEPGPPGSAPGGGGRRSPRSSSDPNMGSWRGHRPAGYEVGEGTLAARSSTSAPTDANTQGKERCRPPLNRTGLTQRSSYEALSTRIEPQWGLRKVR